MAKCYGEAKLKIDKNHAISAISLSDCEWGSEKEKETARWLYDDGDTIFMVTSPELMDSAMYNYILLDHRTNIVYAVQSVDLDFDIDGMEDE